MISVTCGFVFATMLLFPAAPPDSGKSPLAWINSPEAYFATAEERTDWEKVLTASDAERFIETYWRRRGAQFRTDIKARIKRADELFSIIDRKGSETQKGRVWMILGSPTRQQVLRSNTLQVGLPGVLQNNSVERGAIETTRWVYQQDRLPRELGIPELTVDFQTDTSRGNQVIENLGAVEPVLTKAVALLASRTSAVAAPTVTSPRPAVASGPAAAVPSLRLWESEESAGGTYLSSDAYVSATDKTFYAVSCYVPASARAFEGLSDVLFAGVVKDAAGQQVAAINERVPLKKYGDTGDRYVDRSLPLPPGNYSGAFALFSPEGTTMLANRRVEFEVPPRGQTRVSSLLTTSNIEVFDKQAALDPFTFVATKYAVKGDRRFRSSDKVGLFTVVDEPAGELEPSMLMKMTVTKNAKVIDKTPAQNAPLTQTGPRSWMLGIVFDPGTFQPGRYTVELLLRDMKAAKESDAYSKGFVRRAEFDVVPDAAPVSPDRP